MSSPTNDATALPGRTRAKIARVYAEMAEANRLLGLDDLAVFCEQQASALLYGGSLVWLEVS